MTSELVDTRSTLYVLLMSNDVDPSDAVRDVEEVRWIARARTGDESAYRWLLERYRMRAVRLAAHVLRRDSEAEDVAQEAFIRAFREIRSLRSESFLPWLYRIVVRLCLDRKRLARWDAEQQQDAFAEPRMPGSFADGVSERVVVETLLDQLTPPMRAVLVLRELDCLEYHEIAGVLGIPIGTVRSRLNAARSQFRALWTEATKEAADE